MLATETLLFCIEEYLFTRQRVAPSIGRVYSFSACSPSIADENVKASQLSCSLFDNKGTEIFIVQIAGNPSQRKIFARQQILKILGIGFLVGQVIDGNVSSLASKGNNCRSTNARVAACDEYVEALQSPCSVIAVLTTVRWDCEIGLKNREARRGQCYFMLREAIDGVDQLDSLYEC